MSRDTFELIWDKSSQNNTTLQFLIQCAPVIAGLKASNLLIVPKGSLETVRRLIGSSHISYKLLHEKCHKETYLIFNANQLTHYLCCQRTRALLKKLGYYNFQLTELLEFFSERYQKYQDNAASFPHEMGIFLQYPIEDVEGFIRHHGRNYLISGYWKVYQNPDEKERMFEEFEYAQEEICKLFLSGVSAKRIIMRYSKRFIRSIQ